MRQHCDFEIIGTFFRNKRIQKGVSQSELAKILKIKNPQQVSNWERGLCAPPLEAITGMVHTLGLAKGEVINLILKENRRFLEAKLSSSGKKKSR